MLKTLKVAGFKSLDSLEIEFPRLTVLFGPNAAGKSNLLEAVQMLSRIGTSRTLAEAFSGPVRGYPLESFTFPVGGLRDLLQESKARFTLEATLDCERETYHYKVGIRIVPGSGRLSVQREHLAKLGKKGQAKGNPTIEVVDGQIHVRRKSKPAHPRSIWPP